ncbi:PH domain-containing protein [Bacillus spongiae]|uniref:PH domain-containing protein n=1 Tax=Bacillus spongiae TaxID=2683610 RepID=A0ABU8HJC5_9BACI
MEIQEPNKRISMKALTVWRFYGLFHSLAVAAGAVVFSAVTLFLDWSMWLVLIAVIAVLGYAVVFIYLIPKIRLERWRYEVREQEIELKQGVFIIKRTLIPMIRVQHVDTVQGPILKKYDLATITISTAATLHEIPALEMLEADQLRHSISMLARVAEDDI